MAAPGCPAIGSSGLLVGGQVNVSEPAFLLTDVSFAYRGHAALRGLSMRIESGARVALLGPNGSGKSTVLRLMAGLAFAQFGEVSFCGELLNAQTMARDEFFFQFRRRVGVVFQNSDVQLFNPTVFDEVAFGPLQMRWSREEILARVEQTLVTLHIAHLRDRAPHRLSGGEKKRVALASVLVLDPEIVLLDEPSTGLDPRSQSQIVELLGAWGKGAKTVITATHDLDILEEIADRCYVLDGGRVAGEGTPLEILHNVALLEQTQLIRPHRHVHREGGGHGPHLHVHEADVQRGGSDD